jgi:hypothetical protein
MRQPFRKVQCRVRGYLSQELFSGRTGNELPPEQSALSGNGSRSEDIAVVFSGRRLQGYESALRAALNLAWNRV